MRTAHTLVNMSYAQVTLRGPGSVTTLIVVKIGRAIEHFRASAGLTQSALAAAVNMDQGNLSRLINGRQDVPMERLQAISAALGIRLSDLIAYAERGDEIEARWRRLYATLSPEDREAALRLLEPRETYSVRKKR